MRLTHLTIKNFKCFDERGVRLEFAPITMLFGPNNAGKSTVIQALHLAKEVLCHRNPDPDRVEGGGESINLGGFKEFVHRHSLDNQVTIGLGMSLEGEVLPLLGQKKMILENTRTFYKDTMMSDDTSFHDTFFGNLWDSAQRILNRIEPIEVQFTISWGFSANMPYISKYAIHFNGLSIAAIHCEEKGLPTFSGLNFSGFFSADDKEHYTRILQGRLDQGSKKDTGQLDWIEQLDTLMDQLNVLIDYDTTLKTICPGSTSPYVSHRPYSAKIINPQQPRGSALPPWDSDLDLSEIANPSDMAMETSFLTALMTEPALKLRKFFQSQFQYLGPLRQIPPRNFVPARTPDPNRWANGLAAWDALTAADSAQLDTVNKWLNGPQSLETGYLETGYTVHGRKFPPFEALPILHNERSNIDVSPHDMGVGISQIIPVVVAGALAKPNTFIAVEQPELHIHPAWQTALGDLYVEAANQENPPVFLLETHSEHLLLRLLRRIRHTHEGTAQPNQRLTNDNLAVHWVGPIEGRTKVLRLELAPDGSFTTPWPEGFFDERGEELFG